uniref:Reverse transcriptase domain-containing protein n=1 Tax=Sinocyclocheilus grahami TaxID=75366 RepID=A0A672RTW9_SINGR
MATQNNQDYFRSVSSESSAYMMVPANSRGRDSPSKLCIAMVVIVVVVLQIASTTGLFVYLNLSLSQVKNQGVTEELRCLGLLNALDKDRDIPEDLAQLFGEPCIKLAEGIKAYISKVTDSIISKQAFHEARAMPHSYNTSGSKFMTTVTQRPSAHLTLSSRSFRVSWRGEVSKSQLLATGVPQGSVLGPLLFSIYMSPLVSVIQKHGFPYHCYADDTQLYFSFQPDDLTVAARIAACLRDISSWMISSITFSSTLLRQNYLWFQQTHRFITTALYSWVRQP